MKSEDRLGTLGIWMISTISNNEKKNGMNLLSLVMLKATFMR